MNPDQPATPAADEPAGRPEVDEVWTYAGRRTAGGKRFYAWLDTEGRERHFSKLAGITVGGRYTVRVSREADRTYAIGEPLYTGDHLDQAARAKLEARDLSAMAALAASARDRSDTRRKALDVAIEPLTVIASRLSFGHERDALVAYVIRRLTRDWFGERR